MTDVPRRGIDPSASEWRRSYVTRRASEMAKSGRFRDASAIGCALSTEGYIEAAEWLDCGSVCDDLNQLCRLHFEKGDRA